MKYVALEIERKDVSRAWVLVPKDQYDRYPNDQERWGEYVDSENHYEDSEYDVENEIEIEAPEGIAFDNPDWEFIKAHRATKEDDTE